MTASFVAERQTLAETVAATTRNITPAANLAAGNVAVIIIGAAGTVTFAASDNATPANTWAVARNVPNGGSVTVAILWALLGAGGLTTGNTVTVTSASQACGGVLWELGGVATADQTAGATGASTAPSSGNTATLTSSDEIVIGGIGWVQGSSGDTFTAGSGFSQPSAGEKLLGSGSFPRYVAPEYQVVSSNEALAATGTIGPSATWAAAAVTFKPPAVPSHVSPQPFIPLMAPQGM